jgi:hypothetical protein
MRFGGFRNVSKFMRRHTVWKKRVLEARTTIKEHFSQEVPYSTLAPSKNPTRLNVRILLKTVDKKETCY